MLLLTLTLALCGPLVLACGWVPGGRREGSPAQQLERETWLRVWLPIVPALLVFAILVGWALQEPDDADEKLRPVLCAIGAPFCLVWARALARAVRALFRGRHASAATVGLLRPRVLIAQELIENLDVEALRAVHAHEAAHARHRDPARLWIAQLAADLQWPWPSAKRRLAEWRAALELARDEEARASGIAGEDLAEAIVVAARLAAGVQMPTPIALVEAGANLRDRIERLLSPAGASRPSSTRSTVLVVGTALTVAGCVGFFHGEYLLRLVPGVLP